MHTVQVPQGVREWDVDYQHYIVTDAGHVQWVSAGLTHTYFPPYELPPPTDRKSFDKGYGCIYRNYGNRKMSCPFTYGTVDGYTIRQRNGDADIVAVTKVGGSIEFPEISGLNMYVLDDGILYQAQGYIETPGGKGWMYTDSLGAYTVPPR